jgi:hypothetical protein
MRRFATAPGPLLGVLALGLLGGCGPKGPVRHEVTGTVLYAEQPLDTGVIYFEPMDGQGSRDGATITNGAYRIPKDKGLFPGRYKVAIIGGDGTSGGGKAEPESRRPGVTPGKERIPPEYNVKSNVVKEVTAGGPNQFDFTIPKRRN